MSNAFGRVGNCGDEMSPMKGMVTSNRKEQKRLVVSNWVEMGKMIGGEAANVVRFGEHRLQVMPTDGGLSYAHTRVEVYERLNGGLAVYYQGHRLAAKSAPPQAPVLRARNTPRVIPGIADPDKPAAPVIVAKKTLQPMPSHRTKSAPDHPWRRPFKIYINKGGDKLTAQLS